MILGHVSDLGWDASAFSDDSLANKRIFPGFVFKHISDKNWSERGKVTSWSMNVMVRHVIGTPGPQHVKHICGDLWGSAGISGDHPGNLGFSGRRQPSARRWTNRAGSGRRRCRRSS